MNERTVGGICLGPTGNNQGTHYFISLASGKRIHGTDWIEMPMPTDVIERINQFGKEQGFPKTLTFADRHGNEIMDTLEEAGHWEDDDEDFIPTEESSYEDDDLWYDDDESTANDVAEVSDIMPHQPGNVHDHVIRRTPRHEEPHRINHVNGSWQHCEQVIQTKDQHQKFHGS